MQNWRDEANCFSLRCRWPPKWLDFWISGYLTSQIVGQYPFSVFEENLLSICRFVIFSISGLQFAILFIFKFEASILKYTTKQDQKVKNSSCLNKNSTSIYWQWTDWCLLLCTTQLIDWWLIFLFFVFSCISA